MLKDRLRSGFALAAALLAALYFIPSEGPYQVLAQLVLALITVLALNEFYLLLKAGGIPTFRRTGVAGGVILLAATWWSHTRGAGSPIAGEIEVIVLFALAATVLTLQMFNTSHQQPLQSIACTLLGFVYVAWLINFLNKLLVVFGTGEGRFLILYLALVVKMTDVGAFFIGSKLRGPKFFPRISPAKTWSGVIGGLATGTVCSLLARHFFHDELLGMSLVHALILGLLLSAMGILGDLVESLIKRSAGAKDSGTMIQGMGGLLDILDSLIFAAPFLYVYLRLFVEGAV